MCMYICATPMPFYIRDMDNYGFWYLQGLLEPIPHRYQGVTVLNYVKQKSHLVTPLFSVTRKCKIHGLVSLCLKCITGGSLTGAVFNPALALSLHFKCFDEAFLQFFIVYWLAPSLGKHVFI